MTADGGRSKCHMRVLAGSMFPVLQQWWESVLKGSDGGGDGEGVGMACGERKEERLGGRREGRRGLRYLAPL